MRPLAFIIMITLFFSSALLAAEGRQPSPFQFLSDFIFDPPLHQPHVMPRRPTHTDTAKIMRETSASDFYHEPLSATACLEYNPHDHHALMERVATTARIMANNSGSTIESLSFQPHFSGLKGPKLTIMRKDLERALISKQGSANEIFHNAKLSPHTAITCTPQDIFSMDIALNHHIDAWDSDESPLYRSDLIINRRARIGSYFLGTLGFRIPLIDNLEDEPDLRILTSPRPVRQDVLAFAWQGLNLDRLMISGFTTPTPNLHIAGHAGYLEEMFFGVGGEMLYRPYDSPIALGAEIWATTKRTPYLGSYTTLDTGHNQTSILLNGWYDIPNRPVAFGVSYGQFLDGDVGGQVKAIYRPAPGWRIEGFATYSNQDDRALDGDNTNMMAGVKITMPLGRFSFLPDNSRQTIDIRPFARDKGQRINNPYPLYDLTNAWQADQIYRDWHHLTR